MRAASCGESKGQVRLALYVTLILVGVLSLQAQFTMEAKAQESHTITKEKLLDSLENGGRHRAERIPIGRYVQLIHQNGVNFQVTPTDEQKIRIAGKYLGVEGLDQLIAAVRSNYRPETTSLSGAIERVELKEYAGGGVQVFILLLIRNEGPPTVAQNYQLHLTHLTSQSIKFNGPPLRLNESITLPQEGGLQDIVIQPQDAIVIKTKEAIARDKAVSGWLKFALPHPALTTKFLQQPGIRYVISFADVAGKTYEAAYEVH